MVDKLITREPEIATIIRGRVNRSSLGVLTVFSLLQPPILEWSERFEITAATAFLFEPKHFLYWGVNRKRGVTCAAAGTNSL